MTPQLELFVAWLQQPMTTGAAVIGIVGYFFYWLGSKNNRAPVVAPAQPTEEEIKKAQQERDIARRKTVRNNIAVALYKELVNAYKANMKNSNVGFTAPEAYSVACRLFTELRVPDALADIKHALGLVEGKIDVPSAPPISSQEPKPPRDVDVIADNMAAVKARIKAEREAKAAA